jgi:hypothetical protein
MLTLTEVEQQFCDTMIETRHLNRLFKAFVLLEPEVKHKETEVKLPIFMKQDHIDLTGSKNNNVHYNNTSDQPVRMAKMLMRLMSMSPASQPAMNNFERIIDNMLAEPPQDPKVMEALSKVFKAQMNFKYNGSPDPTIIELYLEKLLSGLQLSRQMMSSNDYLRILITHKTLEGNTLEFFNKELWHGTKPAAMWLFKEALLLLFSRFISVTAGLDAAMLYNMLKQGRLTMKDLHNKLTALARCMDYHPAEPAMREQFLQVLNRQIHIELGKKGFTALSKTLEELVAEAIEAKGSLAYVDLIEG